MRILGIDYGDARVGIAITDELNITVQGLETIQRNHSDKIVLKRLDEILETYDVDKENVIGLGLSDKSFFSQSVEKLKKISEERNNYINMMTLLAERVSNMMELNLLFEKETISEQNSNN